MSQGHSSRTIFNSALGALVLAVGLAAGIGGFTSRAHAEDGKAADAIAAGRELFNANSCSACHTLTDAGSSGAVGPSLDNPNLTHDFIVGRVTNGQGPMPNFSWLGEEDIDLIAAYIVQVKK